MRIFTQGLDQIVGHALPVARDPATGRWRSGQWFLRGERCYLVPGDSPMGYRLPLDSLPWTRANDYPHIFPPDPAQPLPPLAAHSQIRFQVSASEAADSAALRLASPGAAKLDNTERVPGKHESAAWISRTAICAEVRNGRALHLHAADFFPGRLSRTRCRRRSNRGSNAPADSFRRLRAAARSAPAALSHHAGPRGDRSQHSPGVELGRAKRAHLFSLRRGARISPVDGKIHARRAPYRHRRR